MKTLAKEHPFLVANRAGTPENPVWSVDDGSPGWRLLNPGANSPVFASSIYFDLAGLSQREKTLFFEGATVQDMLNPLAYNQAPGDSLIVTDLMTTKPLSDAQLTQFSILGNFASPGASLTFEETVYARLNQYVVDLDTASWGSLMQVSTNQIGSLKATASDRIYSYRIVTGGSPFVGDRFDVLACRHLLRAEAKEEPDYEYLMRLRRSYELQQEPDVD